MADLRQRLLDAAQSILSDGGPARISTRAIAKQAGCSDGALYKHFESLDEVLLALFKQKLPTDSGLSQASLRVGERTVEKNLAEFLSTGLHFMRAAMPIWLALLNDRDLRRAYYQRLAGEGGGPHIAVEGFLAYLRAEQRLGRVSRAADLKVAANLLLAATTQRSVFERIFERQDDAAGDRRWARDTAAGIVRGLSPPPGRRVPASRRRAPSTESR